jgi:lysophospholipid acyltransferase (LPLAT)-like uncharacterized protein
MANLLSKEKKRALALKFLPKIFYLLTKILFVTCKKQYIFPLKKTDSPFLVAFWHEYILFSPIIFRKLMGKDEAISVIISEHFDGKVIAKTVSYFDIGYIAGSSTRGGIKALKESFKLLDNKECVAITPDGPKGPRHSVADGIVAIAQKKRVPIVAFSYSASSFWRLKSWDRFLIPKPFSTIKLYASEPFYLEGLDIDSAKKMIKERLNHVV